MLGTAHTEEVSDVVPSGELDRLRATRGILSEDDLRRDLRVGLTDLTAGRMVATADLAHLVVPRLDGTILTALASALARGARQFPRGTLDEHFGRSIGHLPSRLVAAGDSAECTAPRAVS